VSHATTRSWAPLLALFTLLLLLAPSLGKASQRLGESPHDKPGACAACHEPGVGATPGKARPIIANCLSCHPDADMHPVGMAPRDIPVVEGWPLEDGKVTCATCHAEPSCAADRGKVAPWFRGGVPARTMDFCYRCHTPIKMQRTNPHPGSHGDKRDGCAACHSGEPEKGAGLADARLRLVPSETCTTCHPNPVHAGAAEHVGAVQPTALTGDAKAKLPLDKDDTIACWTCHDVHAAGPQSGPKREGIEGHIASARELPKDLAPTASADQPAMLALPTDDGSLCKACHGSGP
jgi:hypothetical protein